MSFVQELKRRSVFRVGVAYVVAAWVIIEVSSLILDIYESPDSVIRIIVALLALGLPFALLFAWAFEVTPEGIKRESEVDRTSSTTNQTAKRLDLLTIGMVVLAAGLYATDRFLLDTTGAEADGATDRGAAWVAGQILEIDRLQNLGDYRSAFKLASDIGPLFAEDPAGQELWETFSWSTDIQSIPPGAEVFRQQIDAPEDQWEVLGTTPVTNVRFARGEGYRLRFELPGHRNVEVLETAVRQFQSRDMEGLGPIRLDPLDALPEEMVRIPEFTHDLVEYEDYFMDRYEVTNQEFERFVAIGGYETQQYWAQEFIKDGKVIPWQQAIDEFVDRTGRPGPSTWIGGTYAAGQGDYPVSGVSWYEAAAYARYADKELPTPVHHDNARRFYFLNGGLVAARSNLGGDLPRPVGANRAMTTLGVYDLIGNVREWCWNETGSGQRATIGGAWTDEPYFAGWIVPRSPWDRNLTHGIRLVRTFDDQARLARLREPVEPMARRDLRSEEPVSDEVFMVYKSLYAYDSLPLNEEVISVDSEEYWTREQVAFDLPYGERGGALLYIPKNFAAPFETVIYWGGSGILLYQSTDEQQHRTFDFLVRSGRAVALPIFKGAYERDDPDFGTNLDNLEAESAGTKYRDYLIKWVQELSRTIDYLETREEFDTDRIGFYAQSWGGAAAPIVMAVEDRFDVAAVVVGGIIDELHFLPEVDAKNFVRHVEKPLLMLNGEFDMIYPLETSQKPMFELLGTDPEHKKHYVSPTSHFIPRESIVKETLAWFDLYLGK